MREHKNLVKNLRRLLETEVSQAEVMMAAKKFAEELQEMVEKIGRLQNEDLPPVTDQMRETYGGESASAFQTQIYSAFQGVMDALYTAKNKVDDAVSNMAQTGQVSAATDMDANMGMDQGMGGDQGMEGDIEGEIEPELDLDNIEDELGGEDELAGAEDELAGAEDMSDEGEESLGRAMKESILQRKVMEMQHLVNKARKLKEAQEAHADLDEKAPIRAFGNDKRFHSAQTSADAGKERDPGAQAARDRTAKDVKAMRATGNRPYTKSPSSSNVTAPSGNKVSFHRDHNIPRE